jgi:hypothetical protein
VLAGDCARRMVQQLDHISDTHLAETGCERASQVMTADIEIPIVAGYAGYSPRCRASSDWLAAHW